MNRLKFRLLIVFMSISLIGIILVQVYWIKSAFAQNDDEFMHHAVQVLERVSAKIDKKEQIDFSKFVQKITAKKGALKKYLLF
jgi:two-component system, OmpR family, phosphate regulon sensor histidine kinase PhoR